MTKKAEKIIKTLEEKLETKLFLYRKNIINYGCCYNEINEEKDNCMEMVSQMFHYHLLSEKDFTQLYREITLKCDTYKEQLNNLHLYKVISA